MKKTIEKLEEKIFNLERANREKLRFIIKHNLSREFNKDTAKFSASPAT